ncbi:cytochrome C peroxidase [Chelatococcus daeguensis]|uniref:Cytochrome C peroxidase n=2 Tax=Chelatococcus daeguensis TaxID=444444 RepID=A0AAC9JRS7_9HYPH|nr:cytochrome C peroxidase [Chelatococcus daeguensis]
MMRAGSRFGAAFDRAVRRPWRAAAGACAVVLCAGLSLAEAPPPSVPADVLAAFARPARRPSAADDDARQVTLGQALFFDTRLSGDGSLACASCHDPQLGFADGVPRGRGIAGSRLPRHTPALWNLAWGRTFFWDGRATSLESQSTGPIESPVEMGAKLEEVVARLSDDAAMRTAFAEAFPERPVVDRLNLSRALAAFERTLVSPVTRFDRFVAGERDALTADEIAGFRLFTGKAGCVACHSGWRFTDEAFHDIGLPGDDRGRGAALGLAAADHAFKTPSLREIAWTAPYMHDGALATLEDVVAHYERGIVDRPTLSADLPKGLSLSEEERGQLIAFLGTLSSEDPPRPASLPPHVEAAPGSVGAVSVSTIGQAGKRFAPDHVRIRAGEGLTVVNDDTRTHNVRVDDPRLAYSSGAQEPGDKVVLSFEEPGQFLVTCGIHPEMRLTVEVAPK